MNVSGPCLSVFLTFISLYILYARIAVITFTVLHYSARDNRRGCPVALIDDIVTLYSHILYHTSYCFMFECTGPRVFDAEDLRLCYKIILYDAYSNTVSRLMLCKDIVSPPLSC